MPNRVDGAVNGAQPAAARPEAVRPGQRQGAAQPAQAPDTNTTNVDRVEISQAGQARNQELQAPNAPQAQDRGAAMNAPGAQSQPAGGQGNLEQAAARNAEQLRERQETERQQATQEPPERQGGLVDVTG